MPSGLQGVPSDVGSASLAGIRIQRRAPAVEQQPYESTCYSRAFSYEWKSGHNVAAGAQNINAAFGDGFANERTIRR
ncbi:unnamed protein product [Angiostrongylus costaricensis]|uniref:SCP domain-containing protein n=1 Tax=Angiostrongylus costaricensis TaxID=334426 RepID=A0A0R3PVR8_ANGCS|nr:unnamed protein product [Angiostrongylus costaricensis]